MKTIIFPTKKTLLSIFTLGVFISLSFFTTASSNIESSNLIQNSSLEEVSQNNNSLPSKWQHSKYGNNTAIFEYASVGNIGGRSGSITMSAYKSGDAKWFFDDVPVQAGKQYTFSGYYNASIKTTVMLRFKNASGAFVYQQLKILPSTTTWTQYEGSFTVPPGTVSMTVFHLIKNVGMLSVDDQSLLLVDTIPPIASIIKPSDGQTVQGVTTISVASTDDVSVSAVHILVDGIAIMVDQSMPYETNIDTTSLSNGSHTITAYAEDDAGNIGNAAPVVFNIENNVINNLIPNHSVETVDEIDSALPDMWQKGGWGTNDAVFTYPVEGIEGMKGLRIEVTSYTEGDAKWFFDDVLVDPTVSYDFSERYRSSADTTVVARFTYVDGSVQYRDVLTLPTSSDWSEGQTNIVLPLNTKSITIFHTLAAIGFLETDNYNLSQSSEDKIDPHNNLFNQGMVSLTFDDGWLSHYDTVLPILNNAGIKGSFYIITDEAAGALPENRIANADLETPNSTGDAPISWNRGSWGTNDAKFTYPVPGMNGLNAAKIEITTYSDGDAKWFFDDATVINGQEYVYSELYQSTATTALVARYTYTDGSVQYQWMNQYAPSSDWSEIKQVIKMPQNLASVTVFHLIQSVGSLSIDDADLNHVPEFVNPSQIMAISNAGHEIGSHTVTHPYLTTLPLTQATEEITKSKSDLLAIGVPSVNTFVYPYGDFNASLIQKVKEAGYIGARSTTNGFNDRSSEKYALLIQQADRNTTLSQFKTWVDTARETKQWLIIMFHQVEEDSTQELGVSPQLFQQMVDFLVTQQVPVVRTREGLPQML